MADFPAVEAPTPLFIHSLTRFAIGYEFRTTSSGVTASFTYTANLAVYVPFFLPWPYPVRRLFWINGSTASSNCDIGIYSEGGARIFSQGSTAQSGASVVQYVTPATPFLLPPGRYYMAWNCSGTTNRAYGLTTSAASGKLIGLLSQAVGAVTLPSPATFATYSGPGLPVFGITKLASGF